MPTTRDSESSGSRRLLQVDALRGAAALMVVLFHYTTRYDQLYVHVAPPAFAVPWGYLGVNLFFVISGFVIFMTLERTQKPLDFVVSRFSRLYPAYWAAVLATFLVTAVWDLPGKMVSPWTALENGLMFHGFFNVHHVDGVYWTLEVELLFYAIMLALWACGGLRHIYAILVGWLSLRWVYLGASAVFDIDLPWIGYRYLILGYIPYFALGIVANALRLGGGGRAGQKAFVVALALFTIAFSESWAKAAIACVFFGLVVSAGRGRLRVLDAAPLVWLGAISYPLYLLHENIGFTLLLRVEEAGIGTNASIAIAIAVALAAAHMLHRLVERPAMVSIRRWYAIGRTPPAPMAQPGYAWPVGIAVALALFAVAGKIAPMELPAVPKGTKELARVQPANGVATECRRAGLPPPVVLLVLGQSNAGNNGDIASAPTSAIVFTDGRCYLANEPLPGATGEGAAIWPRLAARLESQAAPRRIIFALLAVEASEIAAWSDNGPVRDAMRAVIRDLEKAGLPPSAVLWQQGEADAGNGTLAEDYQMRFDAIVRTLRDAGVAAPIFVARSTYCRGDGHGIVGRMQAALPARYANVRAGPNTDLLRGDMRRDECHFSAKGLDAAADLWFDAIGIGGADYGIR